MLRKILSLGILIVVLIGGTVVGAVRQQSTTCSNFLSWPQEKRQGYVSAVIDTIAALGELNLSTGVRTYGGYARLLISPDGNVQNLDIPNTDLLSTCSGTPQKSVARVALWIIGVRGRR